MTTIAFKNGSKAGMNLVNPAACPFAHGTQEARQWLDGHGDGRMMRNMIRSHETRVYHNDYDRFKYLWE